MNILTPYLMYIRIGLVALLVSVAFFKGCSVQANRDAATIQKKDMALTAAADSLGAAAVALRAQNAANKQAIADAAIALKNASNASVVSEAARKASAARARGFEKMLNDASKAPTCKALLDANVEEVCGL